FQDCGVLRPCHACEQCSASPPGFRRTRTINIYSFESFDRLFDVALAPTVDTSDAHRRAWGSLTRESNRRAVAQQIKMSRVGRQYGGYTARHALHGYHIGPALAAIHKQRSVHVA